MLAEDARGSYLVCLPDLTGAIDAISNMRTPTKLCFDLYENRDAVLAAASRAVDAWETVFARVYDLVLGRGAGIIQWVTSWADSPYTLPTCDFNALIDGHRKDFDLGLTFDQTMHRLNHVDAHFEFGGNRLRFHHLPCSEI